MLPDRRSSPSLIAGREPEQTRLRQFLDHALDGRGNLVLISGEAGIGKTTLVEDLIRYARDRGALALTSHCFDLTAARPYAPWLEILSVVPPELEPPRLDVDKPSVAHGQDVLLEQLARYFTTVTEERPLLIALEDMQWADHASLDTLRYLARRTGTMALLLIVSYRDDELHSGHPLSQLLPALIREARAERVELRRLDEDATRQWVSHQYPLSPRDHERLVSHLQSSAEGNPFFITEILHALEGEGVLHPTVAGWSIGELKSTGLPMLLRQVIGLRLEMLNENSRHLLAVAAVIGHPTTFELWSQVTGADLEQLVEVAEEAVDRNLLVASSDGQHVAFSHALIRTALFESILPPRRRIWHCKIAEVLLRDDRADPDLVAHHLQRCGDSRAPRWLIRAGDRAYSSFAFHTAIERYEAALALVGDGELTAVERGWTLLHLAQSYRYIDANRAISHAETAQQIAATIDDPVLTALVGWSRGQIRGMQAENSMDDLRTAYEMLMALPEDEFARVWRFERLSRDTLTSAFTRWLAIYGRFDEAVAVGEGHLAKEPDSDDVWAGLGMAYAALGRPDDARRSFERAFDYYQRHAMPQLAQVVSFINLTWVTLVYATDQVDVRQRQAAEAQAIWTRPASLHVDWDPQSDWAPVYLIEGRWDEVDRLGRQMVSPAFHSSVLSWLAQLARYRGEWDSAWEQIQQALPNGPSSDPATEARPGFVSMLALIELAANLALDQNDPDLARQWIDTHARWLVWSNAIAGRAEYEMLEARYHRQGGDLASAADHAGKALEYATQPRQPLALIAARRLLGEIETAMQRYARAAEQIDAAVALAEACAAPHELALSLLAQTELMHALARPDDARRAIDQARQLCEPLGATPALERAKQIEERLEGRPRSTGHVAGLTARELEVLRLVAQGLTDAEAGEQLFISSRTVSQHLRSIYNKLGVNSRAAAVAFAFEHGII